MSGTKKEAWLNALIIVMSIAVAATFILKFGGNRFRKDAKPIVEFEKIVLTSMSGEKREFISWLDEHGDLNCLIFRLDDCWTCIVKGLQDISAMDKTNSLVIVNHGSFSDIQGWSRNYPEYTFFFLDTEGFYEYVNTPVTPLLLRIRGGKVKRFQYLTV